MVLDFLSTNKEIISIEIGEKYYKISHCRDVQGKRDLVNIVSGYDENLSDDDVVEKIKDFIHKEKIKNFEVINVIPAQYGIYKNIEIPSIDKNEIKQIIDLQAGVHTPYPKNEIIIEYADIGVLHGRYTKILLVILKRDIVTKRYDIIKKAGFKSGKVALSTEIATKGFFQSYTDKSGSPSILVNIDINSTDFSIMQNSNVLYVRSISLGAMDINADPNANKQNFIDEIKRSIEAYQLNNVGDMPSKIFFIGSAANWVVGILEDVKLALGMEAESVQYKDLLKGASNADMMKQNEAQLSLFSVMAPVLLAEDPALDLVPEDIKVKREIKKKSADITKLGIFCMIVLILFCGSLLTNMAMKKLYLKRLVDSYNEENKEVQRLGDISTRISLVKRFLRQKGETLLVLTELYKSIPQEVYLSSINFNNGDTLTFTGTADSMSRVFSLVTELENNTFFKNVKVDFTKSRRQKDTEVADFGLTLVLEHSGSK